INLLLKFIPLSISPRYFLALQVYTTPAQHLDSTWSTPLTTTSASATTSANTSGHTSYILNLPFLALCADQAQHSSGSTTTLQPRSSLGNFHTKCAFLPHEMCTTPRFSPPMRYAFSICLIQLLHVSVNTQHTPLKDPKLPAYVSSPSSTSATASARPRTLPRASLSL
ncbi:hypothetical protein IGI04_018329, partial [Brassica rapa subsp. trilocularis]